MAKILVTGGAGFIGSHIVENFLAEKNDVVIVDDLSSGSERNIQKGARFVHLDIRSPEMRKLLQHEKPEIIVHAAAQISVRLSMEDPHFDTEVNVAGLVNILQGLGADRPFFVMISTGGAIYGEQTEFPAKENHQILPASVYGLAKRVSEMYLDLWHREMKLQYASLRLANVYGPRQNPHGEAGVVAIFNRKLIAGETPVINGNGEQTRDFVFVKDVAAAVKAVSDKRIPGIFNIGTGVETSVNALYKHICESLGKHIEPQRVPAKAGEQMRSCIDAGLAQKTFGWKPAVTIAEGLKITSDWFRQTA